MSKETKKGRVTVRDLYEQYELQNTVINRKLGFIESELNRLSLSVKNASSKTKRVSWKDKISKYDLRLLVSSTLCFCVTTFGIWWLLTNNL